ncbi:MAG TPA: uracil-DNA glycosylase family protein [Anaerolineaceae bacterium]|jgi:uracil-DNA glycosylase family 4
MLSDHLHSNRFLTPSQPLARNRLSAWEVHQVRICACQRCPRLVAYHAALAERASRSQPALPFWNKPVPGFGDPFARLMVIGLSPSLTGSNRTGRLFSGDASADYLFANLHRAGFASHATSQEFGDGALLTDAYIASIGRCAAPKNRPLLAELDSCEPFLQEELNLLERLEGIITLGHPAFDRVLTVFRRRGADIPTVKFQNGALVRLGKGLPWVLCSYHPSPKNTQIDHLNRDQSEAVWQTARALIDRG